MEIKLDQIKAYSVLSGAYIVICLTAGIPYIIYFDYQLFLKIDIFKLIFLSIAISGPTILINTLLSQISVINTHGIGLSNHLGIKKSTILAVISSLLPLYIPIISGFYFKRTLNEVIENYALLEGIMVTTLHIFIIKSKLESNSRKKKQLELEKEKRQG